LQVFALARGYAALRTMFLTQSTWHGLLFSRRPGACALYACICSVSRCFESLRSTRSETISRYPVREDIPSMAYLLHLRVHRPADTYREAG
jgi:hypothetical protein